MKHLLLTLLLGLGVGQALSQNHTADSLRQLLNTGLNDSARADVLATLSWLVKNSDSKQAFAYGHQAVALARSSGHDLLLAYALNNVGVIYWVTGRYDSAAKYIEATRAVYEAQNHTIGQMVAYTNLGLIAQNQGQYETSLLHLLNALRLAEQEGAPKQIGNILLNIGNVHFLREEYRQAIHWYLQSVAAKVGIAQTGTNANIQKTLNNLGNAYLKLGMTDSALYYFRQTLPAALAANDMKNYCLASTELGKTYSDLGQYDSALVHLNNAYRVYEGGQFTNPYDQIVLLNVMASTYAETNQMPLAFTYGKRALAMAHQINNLNKLKDSYALQTKLHSRAGNFKEAFEAQTRFIAYKDSLVSQERDRQIAELQTQYETEKKDQTIATLDAQNQLSAAIIQRNTLLIGLLVVVLLALTVGFYLWRLRYKSRQAAIFQEQKLRMREAQIRSVIESQEQERRRFASDLHDGLGQLINALHMNISSLKAQDGQRPDRKASLYDNSTAILSDIHTEIRNIAFNLMPRILIQEGLFPAVQAFVDRMNRAGGLVVSFQAYAIDHRFSPVAEIALYRVLQELTSNIIKYAGATEVYIQFTTDGAHEVTLTIEDNGTGFDTNLLMQGQGNGWRNIKSRLNLIHAQIELDTAPGRPNTTVIIELNTKYLYATQHAQPLAQQLT